MEKFYFIRSDPQESAEAFGTVLSLPEGKIREINHWLRTHLEDLKEGVLNNAELRLAAEESEIPHQPFRNSIGLLFSFLFSGGLWEAPEPGGVQRLIAELQEIGIGGAEKAKLLLDGIDISPEEAEYIQKKNLFAQSVIPTLVKAEAVCDMRAIFRALPSIDSLGSQEDNMGSLLEFEPVVLVSLGTNDSLGNDAAYSFQLTERDLRKLLKTLQVTLNQLEIAKKRYQMNDTKGGMR